MFIKDKGGIIRNEAQFVKRIDEYVCNYGLETGKYLIGTMSTLYPNIFNSEENISAFHRSIEDWYC
jgi:hypothetical protein